MTCGSVSALPLRFKQGGLSRVRDSLLAGLDAKAQDYVLEPRFFTRRKKLLHAQQLIGDVTRRVENEWQVEEFGKVDKVGIKLFSEVKQVSLA